MKFFTALVTTALAVAGVLGMTINTLDGVISCRPSLVTWDGGVPPYILSVRLFGQDTLPSLFDFPSIYGTSVEWLVNTPVGTSVYLNLIDSNGLRAQSGNFVIGSSTSVNGSCTSQTLSYSTVGSISSTAVSTSHSSTPTPTKATNVTGSTSDALAVSWFYAGAGAVVGALVFRLAA